MKEHIALTLDEKGQKSKTWRVIVLVLLVAGAVGTAAYASQGFTSGQWALFSTPTTTPTFTHTPVMPTATLWEPTETPTLTPTPTRAGPTSYVIDKGDTLYYVAEEYEVNIEALIAYNLDQGIDLTSFLQVGQEILIPPPDFQAPTLTPMPNDFSPGTIIEHTVRPGDILQLLAEEFNTTLDAILEENEDLSQDPDVLNVGQKVRIPINLLILTPATPTRQPSTTATPQLSKTPAP